MQTALTYFEDSYMFSSSAKVLSSGKDDRGYFLTLDHTIFYPQGGGQPADHGTIEHAPIHDVRLVDSEARHYTDQEYPDLVNKAVHLSIDKARRILNTKYHTAGHVLSHAVETLYPCMKAFKGHHFPENAYVEFENGCLVDLDKVNSEIARLIEEDLEITHKIISGSQLQTLYPDAKYPTLRLIQIGTFDYQPCGGTHVKKTGELKGLIATKQKYKGNTLRVSYTA